MSSDKKNIHVKFVLANADGSYSKNDGLGIFIDDTLKASFTVAEYPDGRDAIKACHKWLTDFAATQPGNGEDYNVIYHGTLAEIMQPVLEKNNLPYDAILVHSVGDTELKN